MTACGHDPLGIQALVDGELDAVHAAAIEDRITRCAECSAQRARLLRLRQDLGAEGLREAAPKSLRLRLAHSLAPAPPPFEPIVAAQRPSRPLAWMGGGAGLAIAACAALFLALGGERADENLSGELIASHVRSLQATHLTDVETSDQHVVKPWFNGKLDFAPPVIELRDQGFPLAGGRLDYLGGRAVAAVVYRRGRHVINLFIWPGPSGGLDQGRPRDGYGLRHWRAGGLNFWAVSDVNPADLALFEAELKSRTGG